jgi:hypothetical protein
MTARTGWGGRGAKPQGRWKASSSSSSLKWCAGRAVLKMSVELKGAASVVHSLKYCDVTISWGTAAAIAP